jgi:FkbM family methyltransferase
MLTRFIYPLWVRERLFWRIRKIYPYIKEKNVSFEFGKKLKFDLSKNDIGHLFIIFNGYYELKWTKSIIKYANQGGVFFDVGANYGYYSCIWASRNPQNKVFAFEASPLNVEPLKNNVNKNMLSDAITIIPMAVGKNKGKLKFDLRNESKETGWGGFSLAHNPNLIEVDVVTLDDYAAQHNISKIDVLKIDTEGADTWVLYGAKELLKNKRIGHIFFEYDESHMHRLNILPNEAKDFLEKLDYTVKKISKGEVYACPKKT